MTSAIAPNAATQTITPMRIMVVDDSVVIRGLTARWLEEAGHAVVATASNGRIAVEQIARANPEIVLLDIEMPEMDGITALPLLLAACPSASIVVVSTLTQRNAQTSLKCLALGAVDYLAKPESHRGVSTSMTFRQDLLLKIQGLSARHRRTQGAASTQTFAAPTRVAVGAGAPAAAPASRLYRAPAPGAAARSPVAAPSVAPAGAQPSAPRLRPIAANIAKRILVVGASTGGPRAVGEFLSGLGPALKTMPICVVQHMPPIFTAVFAEHLGAQTGLVSAEGRDGEPLEAGRIYVAPGGKHMGLRRDGGNAVRLRLDDGAPVNFCKPAVDVLFFDAATLFGGSTLAVVLTGMGSDGTHGARAIGEAGGAVLVQDEATSTVWGMPGSIAKAGLAHEILPLQGLAPAAKKYMSGGR